MTKPLQTQRKSWRRKRVKRISLSKLSQIPQCDKVPSTPSSAERELHELTHFPSGHGVKSVGEQKGFMVSTNISPKRSQVLYSWIIPSTRFQVPLRRISRFLPSLRPPHQRMVLSLFQIFSKSALKLFIMVNGFTHSVLQHDVLSGLMKLQDQAGKDCHCLLKSAQSPLLTPKLGNCRARKLSCVARPCMVRSGQSNLDSLLILELIPIQQKLVSRPELFSMLSSRLTGTSFIRMERPYMSASSTRLIHVLWFILGAMAHVQSQPPFPKASFASSASGALLNVLVQNVSSLAMTGVHIVGHSGQFLKAWTVTRLIKEQQLNSVEFRKITLPPHECEPDYQEPQEDRIALRSFENCSGHSSCNKSPKCYQETSSPWIKGSRPLLNMLGLISRLRQPRERIKHHHQAHCQQHHHHHHQHRPQHLNQQYPIQLDFKCLLDFIHCVFSMLNNQGQLSLSSNQISNQLRSEEKSQGYQNPESLQQSFRTSKTIFPSIRIKSMQIIKKLRRKIVSRSHSSKMVWREFFKAIQQIWPKQQSQKRSDKSVMMLTIQFLSVVSLSRNVDQSLIHDGS